MIFSHQYETTNKNLFSSQLKVYQVATGQRRILLSQGVLYIRECKHKREYIGVCGFLYIPNEQMSVLNIVLYMHINPNQCVQRIYIHTGGFDWDFVCRACCWNAHFPQLICAFSRTSFSTFSKKLARVKLNSKEHTHTHTHTHISCFSFYSESIYAQATSKSNILQQARTRDAWGHTEVHI